MTIFIFISVLLTFGIILIKPKWGTFIIWLVLFTYPHGFWYYRQYLPLNIGFDDVFCIFLFLMIVIRRNIMGGVRIRFGYAFWVLTAFSIVVAIAILNGARDFPEVYRERWIKELLKLGIFWGLFYAILHCIDDERDLKKQFFMFSLAAGAGAFIVILQYTSPYLAIPWTSPEVIEAHGALQYQGRAGGAFLHPNAAACVLVCSAILVTTSIRLQKVIISKIIVYSLVFVLLLGVLVTKSRAGLMALAGSFGLMAFIGKSKRIAWVIIVAGIIVAMRFGNIREAFQERIVQAYDPETGALGENIVYRFEIWKDFFRSATFSIYIFGQGAARAAARNQFTSHSAYVSLVTVYGVGGIIWAITSIVVFFKKARDLMQTVNPMLSMISAGCVWALIALGIYGLSADAISSSFPRYLLFYLVVLVDRASYFARQEELSLVYDEQLDYAEDEQLDYAEEEYCVYE